MKKVFLLLSLIVTAFCSAYALSAEEVIGKWESNGIKTQEQGLDMTTKLKYDFVDNEKVATKCDMNMTIDLGGPMVDLFFAIDVKGTYTVAGDSITINYDTDTAVLTFTEDDIRVRNVEDPLQATQMQEAMFAQFSQQAGSLTEGMNEPDILNGVLITGNKMVCTIDGQYVTFKRKKK